MNLFKNQDLRLSYLIEKSALKRSNIEPVGMFALDKVEKEDYCPTAVVAIYSQSKYFGSKISTNCCS